MYNNGYPVTYNPMYYQQQIANLQSQIPNLQSQMSNYQPQTPQNGGMFYFVNSQKDVEDWIVNAGQTVFFFDRNNSIFYIKSVAQNGLSQPIEVYDYAQRTSDGLEQPFEDKGDKYITREEFEALKAELEAMKEAEG